MNRIALGLFAALALGVAAVGQQVLVQVAQPVPPLPPGAKVADPKTKATAINVMTFPTDRDAKQMIEAVQQYLAEFKGKDEKAPWDRVCLAAQTVLDAKSDSFFESVKKGDDSGKFHGVSAKAEANRLIGQFPGTGRQFYQLTYGPPAQKLLSEAIAAGYDRAALGDVSQRYFHTKAGAEATQLLAGFHLERGNFTEAAYSYERLLARPDAEELFTARTSFKAAIALKRADTRPDAQVQLWEKVAKKIPRDGLVIGRRAYSLDELKEQADKPFAGFFAAVGEAYVATRYGNAAHTAVAAGGAPFLDPAFTVPLAYRTAEGGYEDGSTWINQNLADVLKNINPAKSQVAISGFFPVTTPNLVIYRGYDGVYAVVTKDGFMNHGRPAKAGDLYWISDTAGNLNQLMGNTEDKTPQRWWDQWRTLNQQALLFENPLVGSLAHDGRNVYFVDDLAVPQPPQVINENFGGMPVAPSAATGALGGLADGSRMKAVNIETGKLDWQLGVRVEGPALSDEDEDKTTNPLLLTQGAYFLGPPLAQHGKLYVLFERNGRVRLACLNPGKVLLHDKLKYPELLWTQRLGEPNTRLPTDSHRRYQCSYLAYADGVLICPTNAGAVVAVDVMSKSLLWAQSYRFLPQPATPQPADGVMMRGRVFAPGGMPGATAGGLTPLTSDRWRAAAPIISRGRVVFAAFDADAIHCLDLRTGATLWTEKRRPGDLYVGGLADDKIIIVGKEYVRAVYLAGEPNPTPTPGGTKELTRVAWRDVRIGTPAGHGCVSKDGLFYVPLANTPDSARPEVWAISTADGKVVAKTPYRKKDVPGDPKAMLGNLVFHEEQLVSQTPMELAVFPLSELKEKEMSRLLAANPNDPTGLATRGELRLGKGDYTGAVADLKQAEKHDPSDTLRLRMRDKLYQAYTELLRQDFDAGEPFLAEYERLTDVPLDTDDPNLRQKLADEQFRRKGLYLCLLAKGREKQGRLVEAFDKYREFAALGGGRQLVSIYDEPNGQTRPDVWARGRIDAMVRAATDPAARKPLDTRVAGEWASVKQSPDLTRLREFVAVFGPYFPAGREAQLALARKLAASTTDDDQREAQALLLQLAATADEKPVAAGAVEALAGLMTRGGLMEDAVGMYARLGAEFPDVAVRGAKTGGQLFEELLTDKRYLPYLEPTRVPTPERVKVEQTTAAGANVQTGFTFEPDGELLPFFRRYRLSLSANESSNGTWVMRATDRTTGAEWARYSGLRLFAQNGTPMYRLGVASGHTLLIHLGHMAYCYDLAEKKELWQYNLLGESSRVDFNNVTNEGTDGDTISYTPEGFKIRIGRSSVLQPGYACLLTRDGLVALDPATGAKLWTRSNVSTAAQIFGDARHVYVVEAEAGGKAQSKVLRAVDGTPVAGVPDFGPLFAGAAKVRMLGRRLLLNEGGGSKPRTVRLYDPLTGQDVWKKEFPKDAKFLDTHAGGIVGVMDAAGKIDAFDEATGKTVFAATIAPPSPGHLIGLAKPALMYDAERFYVVLNKVDLRNNRYFYGYTPLRVAHVSGPIYAFDRATGEQLWYTDKLFENQQLVTEQFAETPALVASTIVQDEMTNQNSARIIVVDKRNGKIRYLKTFVQGGPLFSVASDPKSGKVELRHQAGGVSIGPDDGPAGK